MKKEQVKQKLLDATKELLSEQDSTDDITVRQIAAKAGTNLAMINYCFESKDELISNAIDSIIAESAKSWHEEANQDLSPKERLWNMLWKLTAMVLKFQHFTKLAVPFLLLQSDIETPFFILPLMREYFGNRKSETEIRVIAYQLTSFLQLVLYRSESFNQYCGISMDEAGTEQLLKMQFDIFFKEDI